MTDSTHTPLGPGAEFDHIRALLDLWGPVAQGIGDDAAILSVPAGQRLVVSTDSTVDAVHFRRDWMSMRDVGSRGATAALSDLAAMGAVADSVLVSLVVPDAWRKHLSQFADGIRQSTQLAGARIVGGNISSGTTFSCTFTVLGHAQRPVRRSGGSPGDVLCVTGTLGGPGAALASLQRRDKPHPDALERFLHPSARLAEGLWLAQNGAAALIDISDGLAADARHLGAASGLHAYIDPALVPHYPFASAEEALVGGEEYELLVALPEARAADVIARFNDTFALRLTRVGVLEPAAESDRSNSTSRVELGGGHDHFSSR